MAQDIINRCKVRPGITLDLGRAKLKAREQCTKESGYEKSAVGQNKKNKNEKKQKIKRK